jgi:hypothetical protein
MWDLKIDTRRLVEGFSTSVPWDRPNVLWNKADDWWNDNYVTDSNTAAFLSATGIIDPNKQNYINNLVIALKNQGIWNKAKAIYPFVSEQRNLLNYTEDFSNAYWVGSPTRTVNTTVAPNSTATADTIVFSTSSQLYNVSARSQEIYTFSVYVKKETNRYFSIQLETSLVAFRGIFDLDTATVTNTSPNTSAQIINAGGGWFRVSVTNTTADSILYTTFSAASSGTSVVSGSGTFYLWGAQLELGSTVTDYQTTINAQEQFAAAYKYNLKDPQDTDAAFRLKIFGTWTFTPTGAKGNGTNSYIDTGLNPLTVLSQNSTHISLYSKTNSVSNFYDMGARSTNFLDLAIGYGGQTYGGVYANESTFTDTDSRGFYQSNRIVSTEQTVWKNGVKRVTSAFSSNTPMSLNIYISGYNLNGTPTLFSNRQYAFATIGDGLSDSEAAMLYTIVQQFQTALNRQV